MNKLREPSSREQEIAASVREAVLANIKERNLGPRELADVLGLLPSGAEFLLQESEWPLEVGVRIASALGMSVEMSANAP